MTHNEIFDRLWTDYTIQNPSAQKIYDLFTDRGEVVENDHIAFRTFNDPRVNVEKLAQVFLKAGYEEIGTYDFEQKKLNAIHYEHKTDKTAPRVFISELRLEEFSNELQAIIKTTLDRIPEAMLSSDELIFSGTVWGATSFATYEQLRKESEYAAWLYAYGFRSNHFTVSINKLKTLPAIEQVNQFLKDNGFLINASGGEVKGTPSELLEQSSIKAGIISYNFEEGQYDIPGCYYEFAKRYADNEGNLYNGFIAKSADKIFESTDFYKK